MNITEAKKILSDNYNCTGESFFFYLYEESLFSVEKFWEYYDCIVAFVGQEDKDPEITKEIDYTYQKILKEFIFHFDPNDLSELENFPEDYTLYMERIEFSQLAYYMNNLALVDDSIFELQR